MAAFFTKATLERVRGASDIVDVIGGYVPLRKAGANFVTLCPFHKEKTPSFHVNPQRQIFHCFGCHQGGDVFKFVAAYENIDFPEAVRRLADRAKIPLETERGPAEQQTRHLKEALLEIHEQIARRWQNALANEAAGQLAREYLAKRQVPSEAVSLFRLGCAPEAWDDTVNWARSKGYDLALMEKAGLVLRKEETDHCYDRFRGRLMFPICDEQGRVVGFSGRVLAGDEKGAKYVNSPETPIFTKSRVFFGLDKSKRALLETGFAVICEGQLDLIACFMAGVQNIVAPQGTAFTAEHARILKRYVNEVVLCFDSDQAGQNATVHALDHLLASGLAVRVAVVPQPHDPDSYIKTSGPDAFQKLITQAEGFFDYYLKRLAAENDLATDKGRLTVLQSMAQAILKTGNGVLIDKYAQKTALRLGVAADAVRAEFRKTQRRQPQPTEQQAGSGPDQAEEATPPSTQEFWLVRLLILGDEAADWAATRLDPNWIQNQTVREIVARRLEASRTKSWTGVAAFLEDLESESARGLVTEAVAEERPIPNLEQQLKDVTGRLRNQHLDREIAVRVNRAALPETAEEERLEMLRQQQALRAQKRQPLE